MKLPMKNQSTRAGKELSDLECSSSGNTELKSDERETKKQRSSSSEELQCQTAAPPTWERVWPKWSKQEALSWFTSFLGYL